MNDYTQTGLTLPSAPVEAVTWVPKAALIEAADRLSLN